MEDKNKDTLQPSDELTLAPPLDSEVITAMPELSLDENSVSAGEPVLFPAQSETSVSEDAPVLLDPETLPDTPAPVAEDPVILLTGDAPDTGDTRFPEELLRENDDISIPDLTDTMVFEPELTEVPEHSEWDAPEEEDEDFMSAGEAAEEEDASEKESHSRPPRKGRPKRKKGYGFLGIPHLLATAVWLAIIVMIGTSMGRMLWVCAADVLAFGRESKEVSVTITANDTIDEIAEKLHDAGLVNYPGLFKLYASIAVDEGDILPGTFQLDTIYDYHALVVQMGPRSSTRSVVYDLLIPEGLNCRQIFELLEQHNVCTVRELEEYAANGEFSDFWFLEGVERGDKYCLEGFLFPDTYDFYEHSTPREALGKMLLGFEARVDQEQTMTALAALNERISGMMRAKGCSEEHIAENQLSLRDLLTVASLIEEETASSKESPRIASVIFNRLTEDQMYERYLNIDAAIIYATGSASNIDTSIDHPYNTYKYAGLTPGPISNPGLESIEAALNFEDTDYYYYVLNPETEMHQFSKTLEEHEKWVEEFRNKDGGTEE